MASADESPGNGSSKKRIAARQISKDDNPDAEEEETPLEGGTFRRASDAVLANRRIVKVRRTPTPATIPSATNVFASIRLVPPSASEVGPTEGQTEAQTVVQAPVEEVVEKTEATPIEDLNQSLTETVTETITETVVETIASRANDLKESETGVVNGEKQEVSVDGKVAENGTSRGDSAVGPSGSSSETFQQLSSAKNAFSASFGTGFSATSISFGSQQSDSTSGFGAFSTAASFGSGATFGSSLFGSSSGTTAFPSLNSVFGKTNGSSTFQLFGSGTAPAASPAPGLQNSTGLTLQEVPLETGEEKEKAVFAADAALFEFLDGGWKERGKGEIRVNVPEETQRRARLVMRSKGNLRLLLNANLFPDMKLTRMDNRGVTFACANSTGDAKAGLTTYAVKMKDAHVAREFLSAVEAHKGVTNTEPRTPESSPKALDRPAKVPEEAPKDLEAGVGSDTVNV